MKTFGIKVINMIAIIGLLLGYNMVLENRERDDQIAKLKAEVEGLKLAQQSAISENSEGPSENDSYADGTYSGEAEGFGGLISVEVEIEDGMITNIEIVSAESEDGAYLTMAKDIIPEIIDNQSTDVDTISGATFSSTGIRNAVTQALEKAEK